VPLRRPGRGTSFEVTSYSLVKGMGVAEFIESAGFTVGVVTAGASATAPMETRGYDLTVILGTSVSKSVRWFQLPPSDVLNNLGKLLESGEGAHVTFKDQDEVFHAHKVHDKVPILWSDE
jgi:hypothetical protein